MPRFIYGGDAVITYAQFLDLETSKTLVAEPGKTYDVAVADGHTFSRLAAEPDADGNPVYEEHEPLPPDDDWKPVKASRAPAADTPKET